MKNDIQTGSQFTQESSKIIPGLGHASWYPPVATLQDHVARANRGTEVVFGKAIRRRRIVLDVPRPFEQGLLKDNDLDTYDASQAVRFTDTAASIVPHAVSLMMPEPGTPIYGVIGLP